MTKTLAAILALAFIASTASAEEPKKPSRPVVYLTTECTYYAHEKNQAGDYEARIAVCAKGKGKPRMLRAWSILELSDGTAWVIGR